MLASKNTSFASDSSTKSLVIESYYKDKQREKTSERLQTRASKIFQKYLTSYRRFKDITFKVLDSLESRKMILRVTLPAVSSGEELLKYINEVDPSVTWGHLRVWKHSEIVELSSSPAVSLIEAGVTPPSVNVFMKQHR